MNTMLTEAYLFFRNAQIVVALFENINFYFLYCVLIIDACITKNSQKTRRGMPRLTTEECGRAVGMVSAGCSFREVRTNVNNLTITGDIGLNMMQHAYLI